MNAAVTGIGLVCHAGIGLPSVMARLAAEPPVPQPGPIQEGAANLHIQVLPICEEFVPEAFVRKRKDLKLMSPASRLGVAAAQLALQDAGLTLDGQSEIGLFVGIGREPGDLGELVNPVAHSLDDQGRVDIGRLSTDGMRWMNPLSSLKTLPNMAVGHISIQTGAMGPNMALCDDPAAGAMAVREGVIALQDGAVPGVLAGAADSRVSFQDRLAAKRLNLTDPQGECGVFLMLEKIESARDRGAQIWGTIALAHESRGPSAPGPMGDCGAATTLAALALAMGSGQTFRCDEFCYTPWTADSEVTSFNIKTPEPEPIAITRVGLATPLGARFDMFSRRLLAGECAVDRITGFNVDTFPVKNACECPDPQLRGAPIPEAVMAALKGVEDRKGELAVAAFFRAISQGPELPPHTPIFYGTGLSSLSLGEIQQDYAPFVSKDHGFDFSAFGRSTPPAAPKAPFRHLIRRPLEIAQAHLGWTGPLHTHFSACAAASAAIGHGAATLRRGEAQCAVVGGADSMVHPFGMLPFILLGATTSEETPALAGRPFDKDRDGFVMGEGAVFFVLETLGRVRADGREPIALLHGWGQSCDAYNVTAPHPLGGGAELAMVRALTEARIPTTEVGYINAHGTGTPLNDAVEARAIQRLFDDNAPPVSSSKGQFGHCLAAAGALEALACLACLSHGMLPPNAHLINPDPRIDLDLVEPGGRIATPRYVLSNSFGFGGQNACLVLGTPETNS